MNLKSEKTVLEANAGRLLEFALKNGASQAEVCAAFGRKSKITLEKQDYQMASADEGFSFGLRVLVGQKQGFASTNSTEASELKRIAQSAVEIAKLSPENAWYRIPVHTGGSSCAVPRRWDEELCALSLPTQRDLIKILDTEATADARFRLNEGSLGVSTSVSVLLNSHGTHRSEEDCLLHWGLMGMAVAGDNITSFDYFQHLSRSYLGSAEKIHHSAQSFRDRVIRGLRTGKGQSYRGLVIFSPRAVLDVLVSPLCHHLNGRNLIEGTTRWTQADIGKKVLESEITFQDDPHEADRFAYTTFDREGTPTRRQSLIENGVLQLFLLDSYAAQALNGKPTGHASGATTGIPTVGVNSLTVAPGNRELSQILAEVTEQQPEFLLVERFSGQTDPVTGDFSGVAKGSGWWHRGEEVFQVKETMISGNLFDVLGSGMAGLSRETQLVDNSEQSPFLAADGVSVTARA